MIVQNGYGNMWTPSQGVQSAVTEQKTPQESAASVTTQARAQERAQGAAETQTQQRVESRDQAQAANASVATNPFEQYQRTGSLSVYA
jgi:predicted  nucleic acid-binding Zn-ribbon protein